MLTARIWLPQPNDPKSGPYLTHEARVLFYRRVLERVSALPDVDAVGGISSLPLGGAAARAAFSIEGRPLDADAIATSEQSLVSPGYFRALGIDLVRGRFFDDHDDLRAPASIIVSDSFARQFFADQNPIGRRITIGARARTATTSPVPLNWLTVVGVVRDVKSERLDATPAPMMYRSVVQTSSLNMTLAVRTTGAPAVLAAAVRREVRAVDPNEPLFAVRTMVTVVASALAERRFTMLLLALFALTALVLAAVGIYGVMAYFVTHRTREIGIRMALGASPRDVVAMVLGQGLSLVAAGVVAGVIGALALTRAISTLLFGISARDPFTFAALSGISTAAALLACYIPARRATRVDPIRALRCE